MGGIWGGRNKIEGLWFGVVCAMRKLFFPESTCKETKLHSAPHSWLPRERGKLSKFSGHAGGSSM
jgi:hypothetical protein